MSTLETSGPQRVPELWFEDANVIFQAGQKLFRVHRSILSARSPIFNDMFSVPQPAAETQSGTINNDCECIHLPDSEVDVYYFFLAIFDASFFEGPPSTPFLGILISILRLSTKYEVAFLKRRAVSHLNALFPPDRHAMQASLKTLFIKFGIQDNKTKLMLLEIMALATAAETRWLIPGAFFITAQIPLPTLFRHASWKKMTKTFQERFLISREAYMDEWHTSGAWIASIPTGSCTTPKCCRTKQRFWVKQTLEAGPIFFTKLLADDGPVWKDYSTDFCEECLWKSKSGVIAAVNNIWDGYPRLLGLPSWDVLMKEKAAFERS
ncbi:hypothetical protein BDZ97DRAFT_1666624 [Flammula alnicola]|nr:hypothetical protein BDZ97DRAFT_1666624 [Flammula alnicola]